LAQLIEKTLNANHFSPLRVYQIACSNYEGEAEFYAPVSTSGIAGLIPSFSAAGKFRTFRVSVVPFDQLADWKDLPGKVFLKIDVEGSEFAFLQGARNMIFHWRPVILLEINPASLRAADVDENALVELLIELGYERYADVGDSASQKEIATMEFDRQRNILLLPGRDWISV
jgi:FkbM family methyltransferase